MQRTSSYWYWRDFWRLRRPAFAAQELPRPPATAGDSREFPAPRMVEGQPLETRPPEKADDKPLFPNRPARPIARRRPYKVTTITDQLHLPWSIAFLPDGKMLVTEKFPAHLRIVSADGTMSEPLAGLNGLAAARTLGLLDVVLAPDFKKSHRIYFSFFDTLPKGNSNTYLAHAVLDQAGNAVHDVTVIYRGVPELPEQNFSMKQGGRIAFAKDGTLFMSVGDRDGNRKADYDQQLAQKLDIDVGKIIHLTAEGAPAPDNPFLNRADVRPEIWAYWHPQSGGHDVRARRHPVGDRAWPARRR